ncbi:AAA-type ATPase lid domain-containing protein [Shewanella goraebulensis]|uniref:sigma 54-interacting transcriptional regulator n=1 Tax=Shewanella goraebulensis TaxID=3050637 RepID=UPI00254A2A6C|nr:sigma 54-interacting transcriptional regulator [Shewanella goraebulensis]
MNKTSQAIKPLEAAVLVIEPNVSVWQKVEPTLSQHFGLVQYARSVELAVVSYRRFSFNLVIIDIKQVSAFWQALTEKNNQSSFVQLNQAKLNSFQSNHSQPKLIQPENIKPKSIKAKPIKQEFIQSKPHEPKFIEPKFIEPKFIEPYENYNFNVYPELTEQQIFPKDFMVLSRIVEAEDVLSMMRLGAKDVISKPINVSRLESVISRWCVKHQCKTQNNTKVSSLKLDKHIGDSKVADAIRLNIINASISCKPLLIEGQSGTGKKLAVRHLQQLSVNKSQIININCRYEAQFSLDNLNLYQQTELGKLSFEKTQSTLVVFNHIDEISVSGQIALMQLLSSSELISNPQFRLISLSCSSLLKRVQSGAFSSELYYQLAGLNMYLAPLNQRAEDIVLLVKYFTNQLITNSDSNREVLLNRFQAWRVTDFQSLTEYRWPGNIQELKNTVEQCLLMDLLPNEFFKQNPQTDCLQTQRLEKNELPSSSQHFFPVDWDLKQIEKAHILRVVNLYQGNRLLAAEHLNISRKTIDRKLNEWAEEGNA